MGGSSSRTFYHDSTDPDLTGQVAIITGASAGIGKETARGLLRKGATVVFATRNKEKTEKIFAELKGDCKNPDDQMVWMELQLDDIDQVKSFVQEFKTSGRKLNFLINNAGVMNPRFSTTKQGYDIQVGTNHLGHFVLTLGLIDLLKANSPSRIVSVASAGHQFSSSGEIPWDKVEKPVEAEYSGTLGRFRWYGHSKYANMLFTRELSKKLEGSGVTAYSTHPGGVKTELGRTTSGVGFFGALLRTPEKASETSLWPALQPGIESMSGQYFTYESQDKGKPAGVAHKNFKEDGASAELWAKSLELTGIDDPFSS